MLTYHLTLVNNGIAGGISCSCATKAVSSDVGDRPIAAAATASVTFNNEICEMSAHRELT